jgi:hypothetical protein
LTAGRGWRLAGPAPTTFSLTHQLRRTQPQVQLNQVVDVSEAHAEQRLDAQGPFLRRVAMGVRGVSLAIVHLDGSRGGSPVTVSLL